jgi:hypothetical protein
MREEKYAGSNKKKKKKASKPAFVTNTFSSCLSSFLLCRLQLVTLMAEYSSFFYGKEKV